MTLPQVHYNLAKPALHRPRQWNIYIYIYIYVGINACSQTHRQADRHVKLEQNSAEAESAIYHG